MFKFLTKSLLVVALWRRYRKLAISAAVLFFAFFIVGELHEDFLKYAQAMESHDYVGLSYVLKWLLLALLSAAFYGFNVLTLSDSSSEQKTFGLQNVRDRPAVPTGSQEKDVFADIRSKQKLSSKADQLLKSSSVRSSEDEESRS